MAVTKDSIKALVTRYIAFAKNPSKLDLQLIRGIVNGLAEVGGTWEFDETNQVNSCFAGLTKLCWNFSKTQGADAAEAYKYFVGENYTFWYHMASGAKPAYASSCHTTTDTLPDWTAITKVLGPRQSIFQSAIDVTSGMYGTGATETQQSEKLWNGRL